MLPTIMPEASKIADENHAVCNITQEEFFAVDLVFPVIDERQRVMIKR